MQFYIRSYVYETITLSYKTDATHISYENI